MIEERYELAVGRIREIRTEQTVDGMFQDYFQKLADFVIMIDELRNVLSDGSYNDLSMEELRRWNQRLYFDILPEQYEKNGISADVIVVDPPRKGCDKACLDTIVKMAPERVVYISCDSATLARDVKYLRERGYQVKRVRGIDQFGHCVHTETCVMLSKIGIF